MLDVLIGFGLKFLLFAIFSIIVYDVYVAIRYFSHVKFSYNVNGFYFPRLPFIGNTYVALFTGMRVNILASLLWGEKYFGMPFSYWYGPKYHYVCNNAEEAKIILNHPKCLNKAQIYGDIQYVFRNSILLVPGEKWKPRRRYLRTAFKLNMIKSYYPFFFNQSCLLIDKIKSLPPDEDLFKFFNKYTFLNFILSASGLDADHIDSGIEVFGSLLDSTQDELVKLMANPMMPAFIWMRTPLGTKLRKLIRESKALLNELLDNRRRQLAGTSEYIENQGEMLLMDLLLSEDYKPESKYDVFNELALFASGATDTTGHTLVFCFTLLGMYPEVQKRVYEEVIAVAGDRNLEHGNIQDLRYTEAFISETMRILPSIPFYGRQCSEDVDLGTKIFPKGANFVISAYHIHRNSLYWPEPLRFDPSRFFPENASKIVPGSYLPFSLGPRNCIGQGMAMVLLKLTVAQVIKKFRITSSHLSINEFILESCISMKASNRLDCNFIPRVV